MFRAIWACHLPTASLSRHIYRIHGFFPVTTPGLAAMTHFRPFQSAPGLANSDKEGIGDLSRQYRVLRQRFRGMNTGTRAALLMAALVVAAGLVIPAIAETASGSKPEQPMPRYVSLKKSKANVRRGPGETYGVDWVYQHEGLPLRVTAEFGHWRRVEDSEGLGGWVHRVLLSNKRTVVTMQPMAELRLLPDAEAPAVASAEFGAVLLLLACEPDWCRVQGGGEDGWLRKTAIWGVDPGEILD